MTPLTLMYLLAIAVGGTSYACTRGPDGRLMEFFVAFGILTVAYLGLAWWSRREAIFPHFAAHFVLYLAVAALGFAPKPRLDGMAGMLYLFIPGGIAAMVGLGTLVRLLARWL